MRGLLLCLPLLACGKEELDAKDKELQELRTELARVQQRGDKLYAECTAKLATATAPPPVTAQAPDPPGAITREKTLELVRSCRFFVKDNVPEGAEFPNQFDETPVIKPAGAVLTWDDQVKIRTPISVRTRKFVCTFTPSTDKVSIRWQS